MTPLTELAAWKLLLLALAALAGLAFVLWFAWHYAHELVRSLHVRRSRRTVLIESPYIREDWTLKQEQPAWERRLPADQLLRLSTTLRGSHEW